MCVLSLESPFRKLAHQIYPPIELTGIGKIGFSSSNNGKEAVAAAVAAATTTQQMCKTLS